MSGDSMSGHAVLAFWTPSVSRDSMPVQHARTEWPLFADNHIYDEKKCPYSKIDNKNSIYIQERTKWTDILRVHIGRPFFRFILHDRKKEKVRSFCSWFQNRKKRFKLFPISSKHIPQKGFPKHVVSMRRCVKETFLQALPDLLQGPHYQ